MLKTMAEALAELKALSKKSDIAKAAMEAAQDKTEKKAKIADLEAVYDDMDALNEEIADLKAEEKLLGRGVELTKKQAPRSRTEDELDASDIRSHDNVFDDDKLGFKNFGDVAMAVHKAAVSGGRVYDTRLDVIKSGENPELRNAGLRQGNGPDGGFLVPTGVRNADLSNEQGLSMDLFNETRVFQLGQEISIDIPAINEKSRKSGSMYGGVTANWIEEENQIPESEPQFRQINIKPQQIAVLIKVSNTLLQNSPIALGQFLDMASRDVMTHKISDAVFNGDGNGKPQGILQSGALIEVAKVSGQANFTVEVKNTLAMLDNFTERWLSGAKWYINKRLQSQLSLFQIGDKPVFIPAGAVAGQPLATLHGLPVVKTEYNQILGDKGDIILANLKAYVSGQHGGGIRADTSTHFLFDTDKSVFKFMSDADGQTWLKSPIEDFIGTDSSSPFVTLAERK